MTSTDAALLNAFARHRDESAFRELAQRHLGLIFHTALRRTGGDHSMAEEISQNVLCAVARKAPELARNPERFAAWLHRAALFESSKAMRKDSSRQRRDLLQHPDAIQATSLGDDSLWQRALPHLDTALDSLPESDRRVVVLHFFERQQFAQIAGLLGKTPAAVQKQSVRALEKLSRLLRSRGVAVPVGLLATGFAIESAKAAPLALLPSLTAAALSATVGATTTNSLLLMLTTHSKILVPCTLLVLALPLALQQLAIAHAARELAGLRTGPASSATAFIVERARPGGTPVSSGLDLAKLATEAGEAQRSELVRVALRRKLVALEPEVLAGMLADLVKIEAIESDRSLLAKMMVFTLARKNPGLGLEALSHGWMKALEPTTNWPWAWEIYANCLQTDLPASQAWLAALQQQPYYAKQLDAELARAAGKEGEARCREFSSGELGPFRVSLVKALMGSAGGGASRYFQSFPPDTWQVPLLSAAMSPKIDLSNPTQRDNWLAAIQEAPEYARDRLLKGLVDSERYRYNGESLEGVTPLIQALTLSPAKRRELALAAAEDYFGDFHGADSRELEIRAWLAKAIPDQAAEIADQVRADVDRKWAAAAAGGLESLPRYSDQMDQRGIAAAFDSFPYKGELKDRALKMAAEKITDPELLKQVQDKIEANSER
jgi:RNA polymerase sigma factor (sigma-70 family)